MVCTSGARGRYDAGTTCRANGSAGVVGKLRDTAVAGAGPHLDLCVSHDLTLYTLRHGVGLEPVTGPQVAFLDGLLLFVRDGKTLLRSQYGAEVEIDA